MTLLSRLIALFPTLMLLLILASLTWLFLDPTILSFLTLVWVVYGFPLIIYRIHQKFYPIPEGISYLVGGKYNPWWGSQQIQLIYNTFPFLERTLHLVPGLFSLWLRLWGAKVGKNVYWVPTVHIIDRELIEIGDQVVFGHLARTTSHGVKPKKDNLLLHVEKIKIGNHVFVGADVRIAPGAEIEDEAFIPYGEWIYPRVKFKAKRSSSPEEKPDVSSESTALEEPSQALEKPEL